MFPEASLSPAKANFDSLATGKVSSTTNLTGSPWIITLEVKEPLLPFSFGSTSLFMILGSSAKAAKTDKK